MTKEKLLTQFEMFADLPLNRDALALCGQDFENPGLGVSGIVAHCPQQHLPRLSAKRTKGGFFLSCVAQRQSKRLLIARSLVRTQPQEP